MLLPFFALIIDIVVVVALVLNLGIIIVGLLLGLILVFLGLVLSAHDNLEIITATPLQLQAFWYLSNDATLMITATIVYLYFFPWHSRTMSSNGGKGFGSSCQIDRQLDGRIPTLCLLATLILVFQDFHTKIPSAGLSMSCLGMASRGYHTII